MLPDGVETVSESLGQADSVVLGPGLDAPALVPGVVAGALRLLGTDTRLVLVAFALGALAELPALPDDLAERTVLTPNDKEAGRLLGRSLGSEPPPE